MAFTDVLKKAFPFISAAASLGGPLGTMAAVVVGKAIGADKPPAGTTEGISAAIATALGDPVQRAALVKAEQDFQEQMAELGYKNAEELEATAAADRASARDMQVKTHSWIPGFLASGVTVGFFALLFLMLRYPPPPASATVMNIMLGALTTAWIAVVQYYFGSSAGSARKDDAIAKIASAP